MKRAISIDNLAVGEILGQDIYDQDSQLLLRKGTVLLSALVEAFRKRDLFQVYVLEDHAAVVVDIDPGQVPVEVEAVASATPAEQLLQYRQFSIFYTRLMFEMRRARLRGQYNKVMQEDLPDCTTRLVNSVISLNDEQMIAFYMQAKEIYPDNQFEVHAVNVCMLACMFGQWMGLNEYEIRELALSALLHDIGETQLPMDIFEKRTRLTESEWNVIKTHPLLGAKILNKNKWSTVGMVTAVLKHHERLDGTGYPYGTPGRGIPVYARIIAAACALDAMTSPRPYRPAMTLFHALADLRELSYGQLDADITRTLYQKILLHYQGHGVELTNGDRGTIVSLDSATDGRRLLIKGEQGYYDLYRKEAPAIRYLLDAAAL